MKQLLFLFAFVIGSLCVKASDSTSVNLQVGAPAKTSNLAVVDSTTGTPISGATVSNTVIQNAHPEIASVTYQYLAGGVYSIKVTPVAQGSGTATITCKVTYTDPGDGFQKIEDKTIVIYYSVTYIPPHGAKLSLPFN